MNDQQSDAEHVPTDARAVAQRRWWLGGAAAAAVIAIVVVAVLASGGDDTPDDAAATTMSATTVPTSADATTPADDTTDPTAGDPTSDTTDPTAGDGTPATVDGADTSLAPSTTGPAATTGPAVTVPVVTGSLDTVVVDTVVPAPPVSMDDVADAGTGMTFRVELLEAVQGEAAGPGEIAGPAVRVTVVATNGGTTPVLMESVVVDLTTGPDDASAPPLSGPGVARFAGELAPGAQATGVYVFDVPVDQRDEVSILVSYLASVSPVVFVGPAPTG